MEFFVFPSLLSHFVLIAPFYPQLPHKLLNQEIADMLKVSESAVKKKLERARKRLKEKYESEGR